MIMDFSARPLPIGVKFYTVVQPHLGQVFSHFEVDSPRNGHMAGYASC